MKEALSRVVVSVFQPKEFIDIMRNKLKVFRKQYFQAIANLVPKCHTQIVIITHILPDRPELLEAIASIAPIALIVAIPYSIEHTALSSLQEKYTIVTPTLDELLNPHFLSDMNIKNIDPSISIIILEIGGYFASALELLKNRTNNNLIGIIEDTETGHRQYEKMTQLPCPVISVARSSLKETEDALVGNSCLFSAESLLRQAGFLMEGKRALVLGFGKVGRGIAHALLRRHCPVSVYDKASIRRVLALSENFHVPEKKDALSQAEIIFGATGNFSLKAEDYPLLKKGAVLISCSSKTIEFDLDFLKKHYDRVEVFTNFDMYQNNEHFFYLLGKGKPINFLDGAVIGPVLALVQGEIIFAIKTLFNLKDQTGIFEVNEQDRQLLADKWLYYFCDPSTGYYRHA